NRRATRFAPGAGAPTRLRRLGSKPVAPYGGLWARRSRKAYSPGCSAPALHLCCLPASAGEPMPPPGGTSTSSSAVPQEDAPIEPTGALRCSHPGRVLLQDYDIREAGSRQPPCSVLLVPAQILRDRRFGHRAGTLSLALLILADLVDIGQH